MKVELDLPDELVEQLYQESKAKDIAPDAYAAELVYQVLATKSLGIGGLLDNRPDWQAALLRSEEDRAAGRVVDHEDVEAWHKSHPK